MSEGYTIEIFVYQTSPGDWFKCFDKGSWNSGNGGGAIWSEVYGVHKLTMKASGTSGMLRFMTLEGNESFYIIAGVHDDGPWLDVVTGLADDTTTDSAMQDYYLVGNNPKRMEAREELRQKVTVQNIDDRMIFADYSVNGGNLRINLVIE